jgi:hypothetical protein
MQLSQVSFESHLFAATIYVAGWLEDHAALRTEELVRGLPIQINALRVDLRAVDLIDPGAFVRVARALARWRDARSSRVMLQFPSRSEAARPRPRLVGQPSTVGMAVSTAMSWPMSTSPG